jgi:hypothetical protein
MGLFSRRHNNKAAATDHNSDHSGDNNNRYSMKRANGNPASQASTPDVSLPRAPDPTVAPAAYLRSIYAVRERSRLVLDKAKKNQLKHFNVDMSKFKDTANYVVMIIKVRSKGMTYTARFTANTCVTSETMSPTTAKSRHTAVGNISMLEVDLEWTS